MDATDDPTWDNTYLLGWYQDGYPSLTTWDGAHPMVQCVVTGGTPPMWDARVKPGLKIHPIPPECVSLSQCQIYAASIGGVYAFGWRIPVDRSKKVE